MNLREFWKSIMDAPAITCTNGEREYSVTHRDVLIAALLTIALAYLL